MPYSPAESNTFSDRWIWHDAGMKTSGCTSSATVWPMNACCAT